MDKEIKCLVCGFITYSNNDMIEHLSHTQKEKQENCNIKILELGQISEVKENV